MERPTLNKNISLTDFNDFYWLKQELIDFCKTVGISTSGGKIEISDRIRHYISTGEVVRIETRKVKSKSKFDWSEEKLTRKTIITDNYKNGENVRSFFIQEIGSNFSFNVIFMKWIKENIGKTMGDAITEWKRINVLRKDKNYGWYSLVKKVNKNYSHEKRKDNFNANVNRFNSDNLLAIME